MRLTHFYVLLLAVICACNQVPGKAVVKVASMAADSFSVGLQLVTDAVKLPVQLAIPADGSHRKFICDNAGKIWVLKNDSLLPKPFLDLSQPPAAKDKERKLGTINGIAFHPQFAGNHKFYVCYNGPSKIASNPTRLVIAEFTASAGNPDAAVPGSEKHILELEGTKVAENGAGIAFGPDGYLYISIGDDAFGDSSYVYHAQDLDYLYGKLLRIDINKTPYAIPPDNPFASVKNARPEIWAYGFRKMWRFSFDAKSRLLFGADVGELKSEEINIIEKGANYGWPYMEGDSVFTPLTAAGKKAFTPPINAYCHKDGICVIGGEVYAGESIRRLQQKYVFADFNGNLFTLTRSADNQWRRTPLPVKNKPAAPFLICGVDADENKELYVMGILNASKGPQGVVYKIVQ